MKILTVEAIQQILYKHGIDNYLSDLMETLRGDFMRWNTFTQMPRPAMHVRDGVLELMPICDNETYYSYKYVNCHPKNPLKGKQTVVATGQLSHIETGYPILFSEMTLLTALRTAATSALATDLMSKTDARTVAIIGTGAQSEFQIQALQLVRTIDEVRYFDIDINAMNKFAKNMRNKSFRLIRGDNTEQAVSGADIIIVCTASKKHADVIKNEWVKPGMHINALGGDTIGKTELEFSLLSRCRIVVEYFDQTFNEGEIQRLTRKAANKLVVAQMNELITGLKKGRVSDTAITLFDSVGIALEDYSVLKLTYELAQRYHIGKELNFTPVLTDQKDLFGSLFNGKTPGEEHAILTL